VCVNTDIRPNRESRRTSECDGLALLPPEVPHMIAEAGRGSEVRSVKSAVDPFPSKEASDELAACWSCRGIISLLLIPHLYFAPSQRDSSSPFPSLACVIYSSGSSHSSSLVSPDPSLLPSVLFALLYVSVGGYGVSLRA
jgi:hypothetical protein